MQLQLFEFKYKFALWRLPVQMYINVLMRLDNLWVSAFCRTARSLAEWLTATACSRPWIITLYKDQNTASLA